MGAPVAIRTASPPPTVVSGCCPTGARPTTRSTIGSSIVAVATSDTRAANPSIADDENPGMSSSATTSEARTQPNASWRGSSIGASVRIRFRISRRTSSTGRMSRTWSWSCWSSCRPAPASTSASTDTESSAEGSVLRRGMPRATSSSGPGPPGWPGTPGRCPRGRWRSPPLPEGSRASCRCRSGCLRTRRRRPPVAGPAR